MDDVRSQEATVKTVLIVDDEKAFTAILSEGIRLYKSTVSVLTASNGQTAKEMLTTANIDCVITDLQMPVMDGFELLEFIQKKRPGTRVITLSWLEGEEVQQRLRRLGVTEMLEKPVAIGTILNSIFAADLPPTS
jgi:two-component system response regulator YesN